MSNFRENVHLQKGPHLERTVASHFGHSRKQRFCKRGFLRISVDQTGKDGYISIEIQDTGPEIGKEMTGSVTDPFATPRTERRIEMGISLFKARTSKTEAHLISNRMKKPRSTDRFRIRQNVIHPNQRRPTWLSRSLKNPNPLIRIPF